MQTKLTLRMDEKLVEQAKTAAKAQGKSVSQIVADYFVVISANQAPADKEYSRQNSPVTQSLRGLLANSELNREDYRKHLAEKYQ